MSATSPAASIVVGHLEPATSAGPASVRARVAAAGPNLSDVASPGRGYGSGANERGVANALCTPR
eukprot:6781204-Lingulodinium_polyedra.AAC.1